MNILRRLKESLRTHPSIHTNDKLMLWSAFTVAFFGFLRVSEFTATSPQHFDKTRTLLIEDTTCAIELYVQLRASKTDPFRHGCIIKIAPTFTSVCAVRAYTKYCSICAPSPQTPAFQFHSGSWLTRQSLTTHLRDLLTRAGIQNPRLYTTHSFRRGAATTAAEANVPDWLIKTLGRWRSDAYQVYIDTPSSTLQAVPRILCGHSS
uniref:Uncharacterized protein LOC102808214 n=1 Tax=Saccoglossus kowalevskii TaxID=10224 RepID=A0ABM0M5S5_SACKO|nr:PREDICTED: uncharacterized protein LOC102808214 [Saccoglossus kowalevskii]